MTRHQCLSASRVAVSLLVLAYSASWRWAGIAVASPLRAPAEYDAHGNPGLSSTRDGDNLSVVNADVVRSDEYGDEKGRRAAAEASGTLAQTGGDNSGHSYAPAAISVSQGATHADASDNLRPTPRGAAETAGGKGRGRGVRGVHPWSDGRGIAAAAPAEPASPQGGRVLYAPQAVRLEAGRGARVAEAAQGSSRAQQRALQQVQGDGDDSAWVAREEVFGVTESGIGIVWGGLVWTVAPGWLATPDWSAQRGPNIARQAHAMAW